MLAKVVLAALIGALSGILAATSGAPWPGASAGSPTYSGKYSAIVEIAWRVRHPGR